MVKAWQGWVNNKRRLPFCQLHLEALQSSSLAFGNGYDFGVNAMSLCDCDLTDHTLPLLSTKIPLGKVLLGNLYSLTYGEENEKDAVLLAFIIIIIIIICFLQSLAICFHKYRIRWKRLDEMLIVILFAIFSYSWHHYWIPLSSFSTVADA
jgi:hypothetical protein